jgi:hypothetical protein
MMFPFQNPRGGSAREPYQTPGLAPCGLGAIPNRFGTTPPRPSRSTTPHEAGDGFGPLLVLAPGASAHHVKTAGSAAACVLVSNVPTVIRHPVVGIREQQQARRRHRPPRRPHREDLHPLDPVAERRQQLHVRGQRWTDRRSHAFKGEFTWPGKTASDNGAFATYVQCPTPVNPDIALVKTGPGFAYAGDEVTYSFAATNTGTVTLKSVALPGATCETAPYAPVRTPATRSRSS